ncbi:hypothetical protein HOF92_02465 [bacterium]|jgi:hypothetical protein|nr:hypothetical protein [bacterium]
MIQRLFQIFCLFLCLSFVPAETGGVRGLVDKLFEILEARHREILSVEENITHNRSEMERESLVRILESKIREFLRKDKQVFAVLEQIKGSTDADKTLLYKSSLDRLGRFRKTIQEIQNLYFTQPLVLSPPVQIQAGGGNFGTFLSSWEKDTVPQNYEKRTQRQVIPANQKNYYDHVRSQDRKDVAPADTYQKFLQKLNPLPLAKKEVLTKRDSAPIDQFHSRLSKDSQTPFRLSGTDGTFKKFFSNLQDSFKDQKEVRKSQVALPASTSPFDIPGDFYTKLDTPEPKRPLDLLMDDLDRMRHVQSRVKKSDDQSRGSRTFQRFHDQLELSKHQKESLMHELGSELHSRESLENIAGVVRKGKKEKKSSQSMVEMPPEEAREARKTFSDFHRALAEPKASDDSSELYHSDPGTTRNKGDFETFLTSIPESSPRAKSLSSPSFSHDWIGSEVNEGDEGVASKNRFRAILKVLKKENHIAMMEREFVDPEEKQFESELRSVFPERRVESKKSKSVMVPTEGPRFDNFPGNVVEGQARETRLKTSELGTDHLIQPTQRSFSSSQGIIGGPTRNEAPLSSSNQNTTASWARSSAGSGSTTSNDGSHHSFSGLIPEPSIRVARAAETRILRRGATLIPVEIEARDIKDRLFPDINITFEVELAPRNFLAGHILESYEDASWTKTVKTDSNGMARIHLLLDLQEHEVNISRKFETSKEKTVCKILITPRI